MNNKCFLNFKYCWNYIKKIQILLELLKKKNSNTVGIIKKISNVVECGRD